MIREASLYLLMAVSLCFLSMCAFSSIVSIFYVFSKGLALSFSLIVKSMPLFILLKWSVIMASIATAVHVWRRRSSSQK